MSHDTVLSFKEKPITEGGYINGGFFVLQPEVIDYIPDDLVELSIDSPSFSSVPFFFRIGSPSFTLSIISSILSPVFSPDPFSRQLTNPNKIITARQYKYFLMFLKFHSILHIFI